MKKNNKERKPDMRKDKDWFNKGFYIFRASDREHYRAYTTNPERYAGSSKDFRTAVTLAISTAHTRGVLNWKATVAWARKERIKISYDDVFEKGRVSTRKGFYVRRSGTSTKGKRYEGIIGESAKTARLVASGLSKREVVRTVLPIAKRKPFYDEFSTIEWLKRNNLQDLIMLARIAA